MVQAGEIPEGEQGTECVEGDEQCAKCGLTTDVGFFNCILWEDGPVNNHWLQEIGFNRNTEFNRCLAKSADGT